MSIILSNPISTLQAIDLPQASRTGFDVETPTRMIRIRLDLLRHGRTRADNSHFVANDVEELRNLVERIAAQRVPTGVILGSFLALNTDLPGR